MNEEEKRLFEIAIAYIMSIITRDIIEVLNALPNENKKGVNKND